jgi:UDP-2,4-diacetamido-2,4,6-trideoxy-beta-L-altropyranose hydrolase
VNPLQVIFRTDASLDIGTGHVMRCLTLARALRERGAICQFVCRDLPGNLIDFVESQGFRVCTLPFSVKFATETGAGDETHPVPHAAWLGVNWYEDARETLGALSILVSPEVADWLVIDHYAIDVRWEVATSSACRRLLVIDDLADRAHQCDRLLDQNIGRHDGHYKALVNRECKLMAGTNYALLRPEFAQLREFSQLRRAGSPVRSLLVSLGGIDGNNATGIILDGLAHCDLPPDLEISVVMGAQAPWLDAVLDQAARLRWQTTVATNVAEMALLMADADIAIGAAGTTTWERCCVGLPSLVVGTAANQRYVLSQLATQDIVVIGDIAQLHDDPRRLAPLMNQLIDHRHNYSERAAALTNGKGCELLAEVMLADY